MKFSGKQIFYGTVLFVSVMFCGCVSKPPERLGTKAANPIRPSIRNVYFIDTPVMKPYAERAREVGNEVYPKVVALLSDGSSALPDEVDIRFEKPFSIFIRKDPAGNRQLGYVRHKSKTVHINTTLLAELSKKGPKSLREDSQWFDKVITHELAHVAQHYPATTFRNHRHWAEGIADYVRYKLGETNGWRCPECSVDYSHYTSGYTCAGAFLLYVDELYGADTIRQMNSELRRGTFSDEFFVRSTGKTLNELWSAFQTRPEFKPIAAELEKLRKTLGYVNNKPPGKVKARFEKHLEAHPNAIQIKGWFSHFKGSKQITEDIHSRMLMFLYFTQPGGTPETFIADLIDRKKLPGDIKEEEAFYMHLDLAELLASSDANSRTVVIKKANDSSAYNYAFARTSRDAGWVLQKAWRASPDGKILAEFPL